MNPKLILLALAVMVLLLSGCEKEILRPGLDGEMVGYAITFDEFGNIFDDHSNILITITGEREYTTRTDKDGRFAAGGIPTGTYDIIYEKAGFGTMKMLGVQHLGGAATIVGRSSYMNIFGKVYMNQLCRSMVTNISQVADTLIVELTNPDHVPNEVTILGYFSEIPGFNLDEAEVMSYFTVWENKGQHQVLLNKNFLTFPPGTTVYARAFVLPIQGYIASPYGFGYTTYYDFQNDKTIYPAIGAISNEISFVIP